VLQASQASHACVRLHACMLTVHRRARISAQCVHAGAERTATLPARTPCTLAHARRPCRTTSAWQPSRSTCGGRATTWSSTSRPATRARQHRCLRSTPERRGGAAPRGAWAEGLLIIPGAARYLCTARRTPGWRHTAYSGCVGRRSQQPDAASSRRHGRALMSHDETRQAQEFRA
jgi:hypothetical protein